MIGPGKSIVFPEDLILNQPGGMKMSKTEQPGFFLKTRDDFDLIVENCSKPINFEKFILITAKKTFLALDNRKGEAIQKEFNCFVKACKWFMSNEKKVS